MDDDFWAALRQFIEKDLGLDFWQEDNAPNYVRKKMGPHYGADPRGRWFGVAKKKPYIYMDTEDPWVLAHEAGHAIEHDLQNQAMEYQEAGSQPGIPQPTFPTDMFKSPVDRFPSSERDFVKRRGFEAIRRYLGEEVDEQSLDFGYNIPETAADLWGGYLTEPDSIPVFREYADSVVSANPHMKRLRSLHSLFNPAG